jgi:hypothetical protein
VHTPIDLLIAAVGVLVLIGLRAPPIAVVVGAAVASEVAALLA